MDPNEAMALAAAGAESGNMFEGIDKSKVAGQVPQTPASATAPTVASTTTVSVNETVFIENVSKDAQVIADLNLAWAGCDDGYDHTIRPMSREQVNNSLGVQTNIHRKVFREVSRDEAVAKMAARSDAMHAKHNVKKDGSVTFEGDQMTEITPAGLNEQLTNVEQDTSQLVPDIDTDQ